MSEDLKEVLYALAILFGIVGGVWLGGYVMLYGGLLQILNSFANENTLGIIIGLLKMIFCEVGFVIPIYVAVFIAMFIEEQL